MRGQRYRMRSCPLWSARLGAKLNCMSWSSLRLTTLACVAVGLCALEVRAQVGADAGLPAASTALDARQRSTAGMPGSAPFAKTINPAMLTEGVQARLRERAAARARVDTSAGADSAGSPPRPSEAARRIGEARMRRVQAFETHDGVTILSNRVSELPLGPSAPIRQSTPPEREGETLVARPALTEARGLRAAGTSAPVQQGSTSDGWGWPIAALLAVGAAVGTALFGTTWLGKLGLAKPRLSPPGSREPPV